MATGLLAATCCVTAFASAALLVPAIRDTAGNRLGGARVRGMRPGKLGTFGRIVRQGVSWAKPPARGLLKIRPVRVWADDAVRAIAARGVETTPENAASLVIVGAAVAFAGGAAVSGGPIGGLAIAACALALAQMAVRRGSEDRKEELRETVPEALRSMGACFQAGFSLQQTFRQVAREVDGPLRGSFEQAVSVLDTGGTVPQALAKLRQEASSELAFVAVALDIQHTAGGSMKQVLDAAGDSIASDLELRRSMRVQTAQAKLSARVVSAMPFVLIAVFTLTTEDFLAPFFQSAAGFMLLAIAVAMQASGVLLVRRMLSLGDG